MTINRVWNFSPGPATLPTEVLEQVQAELVIAAQTLKSLRVKPKKICVNYCLYLTISILFTAPAVRRRNLLFYR